MDNLSAKKTTVANLEKAFKEAKSFVLADYQGLNAGKVGQLRRELRQAGGSFFVAKNTLIKRALNRLKIDPDVLNGPTAIIFGESEDINPIKALLKFVKEEKLPTVKYGYFDGQPLNPSEVVQVAALPSREVLISRLLGMLLSPVSRLQNVFISPERKLVSVLAEISKIKRV